jgi:hypothetical protein
MSIRYFNDNGTGEKPSDIKLYASTGVETRTGENFNLTGNAWQYRWGEVFNRGFDLITLAKNI